LASSSPGVLAQPASSHAASAIVTGNHLIFCRPDA